MILTLDTRRELKERLKRIQQIEQILADAEAELSIVKQRDPLTKPRAAAESEGNNSGGGKEHPACFLSRREEQLVLKVAECKAIVNDYKAGMLMLSQQENDILKFRYAFEYSQEDTAKHLNISLRSVQRQESDALRKMELQMRIM